MDPLCSNAQTRVSDCCMLRVRPMADRLRPVCRGVRRTRLAWSENTRSACNRNERHGTVDQAKGKVKQAVGTVTGNDRLKAEGHVDETVGKVEAAVGRTSHKAGDAITRVGKAVKR